MNKIKKHVFPLLGLFILITGILMIPSLATIYVENPKNQENPPDSNVVLSDAFTTVSGTDCYIHSDNKQQVIITEDEEWQGGAIWYQYPIDLSYDFSFEMYIYLGNKDNQSNGADGMTFTLHNDPNGLDAFGGTGGGLGVENMENFLSIEMDTYRNPGYDLEVDNNATTHFGIITPEYFDSSPKYHRNLIQIFDGYFLMDEWRTLDVDWDASSSTLYFEFEGQARQAYIVDVQKQFGSTSVYWGFTGATGGQHNFQSVSISKLPQEPTVSLDKKVRNVTAGESLFRTATTAENGDIVEYQVLTGNLSTSIMDLVETVFQDTLDPSLTYIDGSFRIGSTTVVPTLSDGMLSADLGTVTVGSSKTITFQCQVTGSGTDGIIHNTAVVGSKYSAYLESEKEEIYVQPDTSISKNVDKTQTYTGDTLTYTITLGNPDGCGNWDGSIRDQLDSRLGNISVSIDYSDYSGATLTPDVSAGKLLTIDSITLKDGERLIVTVQADIEIENDDIAADTKIINQASATGNGRTPAGSGSPETVTSTAVTTLLIQDEAAFTITKHLDQPASEHQSFAFLIEYKKTETSSAAVLQYGIVPLAKGQSTGSIRFPDMRPGVYTVTEIENGWRYAIDSTTPLTQTQTINWKFGQDHTFTFLNNHDSSQWQGGSADITNQMLALPAS